MCGNMSDNVLKSAVKSLGKSVCIGDLTSFFAGDLVVPAPMIHVSDAVGPNGGGLLPPAPALDDGRPGQNDKDDSVCNCCIFRWDRRYKVAEDYLLQSL